MWYCVGMEGDTMASKKVFSSTRQLQQVGRAARSEQSSDEALRELFETLNQRHRPEDVAQMILDLPGTELTDSERKVLNRAAENSFKRMRQAHPEWYSGSSMSQDFKRADDMSRQAKVARALFHAPVPQAVHDVEKMASFIGMAGREIEKKKGRNDFLEDRLDRKERRAAGITISKRQYNKRWRLLKRMEAKVNRMASEQEKRTLTMVSKSRLACRITWEEFTQDIGSALFIAYITARQNLRSEFTVSSQERAYDEIGKMLLERCRRHGDTNWWAIAHAWPDVSVVRHLTEEQKGLLLAKWYGVMERLAILLKGIWKKSSLRKETMIVKRGDDSTTWNVMAGAWNKAREGWFAVLHDMGMERMVDEMCPGKVMRLIAGDVQFWHQSVGEELAPDTKVWRELPLPWDVLSGRQTCTKKMVLKACEKAKMNPYKSAWAGPRLTRTAVAFRPTPELVHGVSIGHPGLAKILRTAGWFSGKMLKKAVDTDVRPKYNKLGFAVGVEVGGKKRKQTLA